MNWLEAVDITVVCSGNKMARTMSASNSRSSALFLCCCGVVYSDDALYLMLTNRTCLNCEYRTFIYLFIYSNFCMCASMILGMVIQTAEQPLIQKAQTPKNSDQNFPYYIKFYFNNRVDLICFFSDWSNELVLCLLRDMLGYKWFCH